LLETKKNPLNFEVLSKKNNTMFTFRPENLTYSQFYLEFSYSLTTDHIFGYGERAHEFKLSPGMYTIWLNDTGTPYDDGKGGKNLYGHHPFILNRVSDGTFFGLLFVNTNAQDLIISKPGYNGTVNLTQKTIGGEIEFFLFRGATPLEVITKYQTKIGFPALPPVWALGWINADGDIIILNSLMKLFRNTEIFLFLLIQCGLILTIWTITKTSL